MLNGDVSLESFKMKDVMLAQNENINKDLFQCATSLVRGLLFRFFFYPARKEKCFQTGSFINRLEKCGVGFKMLSVEKLNMASEKIFVF